MSDFAQRQIAEAVTEIVSVMQCLQYNVRLDAKNFVQQSWYLRLFPNQLGYSQKLRSQNGESWLFALLIGSKDPAGRKIALRLKHVKGQKEKEHLLILQKWPAGCRELVYCTATRWEGLCKFVRIDE